MIGFLIEVWIMLALLLAVFFTGYFTGYWVGKQEPSSTKLPEYQKRRNLIDLNIRLGNLRYKASKRRNNTLR